MMEGERTCNNCEHHRCTGTLIATNEKVYDCLKPLHYLDTTIISNCNNWSEKTNVIAIYPFKREPIN